MSIQINAPPDRVYEYRTLHPHRVALKFQIPVSYERHRIQICVPAPIRPVVQHIPDLNFNVQKAEEFSYCDMHFTI